MPDPVERLISLAILIAEARTPVTAEQIRAQVPGYSADQDEATFLRMFERDKEMLRAAGLEISVVRSGGPDRYLLDADATFAGDVELSAEDATLLRIAGEAMVADPSFPYSEDLLFALAKIASSARDTSGGLLSSASSPALLADETPSAQGSAAAELTRAIWSRKRIAFGYRDAAGRSGQRTVEPYGLFVREGRWYLVARDPSLHAMRVFAVVRMSDPTASELQPKTPDFEIPRDFDVSEWVRLPFQLGSGRIDCVLRLSGPAAARAESLTGRQGSVQEEPDGCLLWHAWAADIRSLCGWVVEHGPGIDIVSPPQARDSLIEGLREVEKTHGG